jgi:hypothetical protein
VPQKLIGHFHGLAAPSLPSLMPQLSFVFPSVFFQPPSTMLVYL